MRTGLTVVSTLVALAATPAWAFECKTPADKPQLSLRWVDRTLEYGIRANNDIDADRVQASFDAWAAPDCSDLEFRYVGFVAESDPVNQVVGVDTGWLLEGRPADAVAITETSFRPSTGDIERAVIQVNRDRFAFGDATTGCSGGLYDFEAVMTHEVGHFLGLAHTQAFIGASTDPTMAPRVDECEVDKRSLEPDDIAGLCFIYPSGGETGRCGGLPDQASYVDNTPFGCRCTGAYGPPGWLILGVLGLAARRRIRHGSCGRIRSGG